MIKKSFKKEPEFTIPEITDLDRAITKFEVIVAHGYEYKKISKLPFIGINKGEFHMEVEELELLLNAAKETAGWKEKE
jgi:hypothetical protein